jgi:hypothetical protein
VKEETTQRRRKNHQKKNVQNKSKAHIRLGISFTTHRALGGLLRRELPRIGTKLHRD